MSNSKPQSCTDITEAELGTPDVDFKLRAERIASSREERIYTITYEAIDAAGNAARASINIYVPLH